MPILDSISITIGTNGAHNHEARPNILACMIQHPISHILLLTCLIMQFHGNSMHACAYKLQIHHTQYHSCSWSDILFELTLLHTQIHELRVDHSPRSFNLHPFLLILECSFPIHNLESKCPMVLPLSLKVDSLSLSRELNSSQNDIRRRIECNKGPYMAPLT